MSLEDKPSILTSNPSNTRWICEANSLVGEMMTAPTSASFNLGSRLNKCSKMGMRNANVFPEPVGWSEK